MKNTDYVVYLITRRGATTKLVRDKRGWAQTAPSGVRRRCTAEQVLNHLLPALVLGESVISTRVKLKRGRRFNERIERLRRRTRESLRTSERALAARMRK